MSIQLVTSNDELRTSRRTCRNLYLKRLDAFGPDLLEDCRLNLISLFCGGGGIDLGLGFAGFRTLIASDIAPVFVSTVVGNIRRVVPCAESALDLSGKRLCDMAETNAIDLVAAGPPCQAFSILGRRGALDDPRGKLALKYFELVAEIQPRAFLFENVPGLLTVNKGADWAQLIQHATNVTHYHLHVARLNSVVFGVPQYRERIFLVGFRDNNINFEFPTKPTGPGAEELLAATHGFVPSKWALEDVDGLPNQSIREHGERVRARYMRIQQGDRDRTDHTDRIHPEKPSGTVLVGSGGGGGRPHIHPYKPRVITVREAARLQSFPDWYIFHGGSTAEYRQVGNAVPPLLVYEVGKKIAQALKGR